MNEKTVTPLVLLVDDNHASLYALEAVFVEEGYQLATASSGQEALDLAVTLDPDVILLDVLMPDIDGFEVCRRIRATPQIAEVPIVLLTALTDTQARITGFEAGADDFVTKPLDRVELTTRVRSITRLNRYRRLVAERNRLEQLVQLAPCGWIVCDDQGRIRLCNLRILEMLGIEQEESLFGTEFSALFARDDRERVRLWLGAHGQAPRPPIECLLACLGSAEKLSVELVVGAFEHEQHAYNQILINDIGERKRLEQVQTEARFRTLITGASDLIATLDTERTFTYASPTSESVFGIDARALIGIDLLARRRSRSASGSL
ncbi:MAG: response regulator [Bradymonadaceae bacterium]|nr:response regulator [Lujinxingiaceae bacterium]